MVATCIFVIKKNKDTRIDSSGTITVIINSKEDKILDQRRISYNEGDTLFEVLDKEYELTYKITMYGHYITGIKGNGFSVETDGKTSWIWFELAYLNEDKKFTEEINFDDYEEASASGIDSISLKDNMIFGMNERDNSHSVSIFHHDITLIHKEANRDLIFRIIVYTLVAVFILFIIIYIIISRKIKNSLSIKDLAILAFMTVILFVQEEILSVLPNIQLTFLLLAVYVKVFGFKKTSLIVLAHVLLDNMIMGSLTPIVMIPMLFGYMIYIGLVYLVRNKSIWLISLIGILGSLIYCYLFLVVNQVFLDIDIFAYWISDIPFEILLALSTVTSIIYLFKPLSNKLNELWNPQEDVLDNDYETNGEI